MPLRSIRQLYRNILCANVYICTSTHGAHEENTPARGVGRLSAYRGYTLFKKYKPGPCLAITDSWELMGCVVPDLA